MQHVAEHLTVKVFVYGTLKKGECRARVLEPHAVRWEPAALLGFNIFDLGAFPCIAEGSGQVFGELVECNNPIEVIKRLDAIEGYHPGRPVDACLYVRRKVDAILLGSGRREQAFTYVWADQNRLLDRKPPQVMSGNWREVS